MSDGFLLAFRMNNSALFLLCPCCCSRLNLSEDVQQFAAKMTGRSSRSAAKNVKATKADSSDAEMGGSDDEKIISDEEAVPKRVSRGRSWCDELEF